jgi:hypothetical protein
MSKGIKTTIVGALMVGLFIYHYFKTGELDYMSIVAALTAIGFFLAKDQNQSHTK